jgi:hypothetical protein
MKTYTLIKKGFAHPVFCEDFLVNETKGHLKLLAVFDGCSSGTESHFASALNGKIVRNAFTKIVNLDEDLTGILKEIIFLLSSELIQFKSKLALTTLELLSTAIIALVDTKENRAEIVAIGDGVIATPDDLIIIDHENKPEYMIYFSEKIDDREAYDKWWETFSQRYSFKNFESLAISTDGVLSYRNGNLDIKSLENIAIKELLLGTDYLKSEAMLGRQHNLLEKNYKLVNFDDIAVIRITNYDQTN